MLASLALLTACSTNPVVATKYIPVLPPAALTETVVEPQYSGHTNEDHLHYTLELRGAVRECNANLDALRQWRESENAGGRNDFN